MKIESFAKRLKNALEVRNIRAVDLCEKTKIPRSAISHYLSGKYEARQDRVDIIAQALDVSPAWLMGFDVPMKEQEDNHQITVQVMSPKQKDLIDRISQMTDEEFEKFEKLLSMFEEMRK